MVEVDIQLLLCALVFSYSWISRYFPKDIYIPARTVVLMLRLTEVCYGKYS